LQLWFSVPAQDYKILLPGIPVRRFLPVICFGYKYSGALHLYQYG
jgi:hypothetical protein